MQVTDAGNESRPTRAGHRTNHPLNETEDPEYRLLNQIHSRTASWAGRVAQLGRILWARRTKVLAYFDTGATNGRVEAIDGRLEQYILRSLIRPGQLTERFHALQNRKSCWMRQRRSKSREQNSRLKRLLADAELASTR